MQCFQQLDLWSSIRREIFFHQLELRRPDMNLEWAPPVMRVVSRLMWKSTTQLPVASFSDVIHPQQQRRRDRETECLRDLQVVVNCSHTKGPLFSGEVLKHISVASVRSQRHSRDCLRQRLGY